MSIEKLSIRHLNLHKYPKLPLTEAVAQKCSVKKVFLKISQNSQKNTYARVSFLIRLHASGLPVNFAKFLDSLQTLGLTLDFRRLQEFED